MKTLGLNRMLSLFFLLSGGIAVYGQESQSEVPGDHFSLEGALELFKKSASPQEFEQLLNSADAKVNNLDLNGDGNIDYIKVIDRNEGNVHAFILQAIVSETESQDVAVIELEKLANGKAVLQITGDEDVYGIETIIEPTEEVRINAGTSSARTVVNVWAWPSVQYVYGPYYSGWISPWRWSMRPLWWHTWRPVAYYEYNPWWQSYRPYYSVCYTHRVAYAQRMYRPYRTTSVVFHNRHNSQIAHYRSTRNDNDHHGRGRYDDGRSNGRQNNSTNRNDTNGRQMSAAGQHRNSRSSANNWSQLQGKEDLNRRSPVKRDEFPSANRSTSDFRSAPNVPQRNSTGQQRDDLSEKWSGDATNNNVSRQRVTRPTAPIDPSANRSTSDFRSVPNVRQRNSTGQQRDDFSKKRSGAPTNNNVSRERVTRPTVPTDRRGSSGSPNIQRSGNRGGGKSSGEHQRGRH